MSAVHLDLRFFGRVSPATVDSFAYKGSSVGVDACPGFSKQSEVPVSHPSGLRSTQ